jgi:hypothetical protein
VGRIGGWGYAIRTRRERKKDGQRYASEEAKKIR